MPIYESQHHLSREEILERLLEATSLLHHVPLDKTALRKSFALIAALAKANAVWMYRLKSNSAAEYSWCTYGIESQSQGWRELEAQEFPIFPDIRITDFQAEVFQPIKISVSKTFWCTAVCDKGLMLVDTEDEAMLCHLFPYVRALCGFMARKEAAEKIETQRNHRQRSIDNTSGQAYYKNAHSVHASNVVNGVTHQREVEEREEISRLLYNNFIKHTTEGIYNIYCDPPVPLDLPLEAKVDRFYEGAYIRDCNRALALMYGSERAEDLIGTKIADLHTQGIENPNRTIVSRFFSEGLQVRDLETTELRMDGRRAWFVNHSVGLVEHGQLIGVWGGQIDITSRKQVELALRHSKQRIEVVLDAAKLGFWEWNPQTDVCYYNVHWGSMLGFSPDEIMPHRRSFELLIHSEDRNNLWSSVQRHFDSETPYFESEFRMRTKSSGWKWVYDQGRIVERDKNGAPTKVVGIHMDIDERKRAEEELRGREAIFRSLFEDSPLAILFCGKDGDIRQVNSRAAKLLGNEVESLVGQQIQDFTDDNTLLDELGGVRGPGENNIVQLEQYLIKNNGERILAKLLFSVLYDAKGRADRMICSIDDITNLRQAQQHLRRKLEELDRNNEMLTRYIDSNTQLENFAHTVSHDLREPVRTMNSFAQLLSCKYGTKLDEDAVAYLGFIADSAQHMNTLIEDLLAFASFTNNPESGFETVDVQALVKNVQISLRGAIKNKDAEIIIKNPLPILQGNPTKLRQLFQNLISNGIKFSRKGVRPVITINAHQEGALWYFSVSDNGIGIDQADYKRVFQLFRRLHSKKIFSGSGIGLALCKRVVEQHGGQINVKSTVGEGSIFYFSLHQHYS